MPIPVFNRTHKCVVHTSWSAQIVLWSTYEIRYMKCIGRVTWNRNIDKGYFAIHCAVRLSVCMHVHMCIIGTKSLLSYQIKPLLEYVHTIHWDNSLVELYFMRLFESYAHRWCYLNNICVIITPLWGVKTENRTCTGYVTFQFDNSDGSLELTYPGDIAAFIPTLSSKGPENNGFAAVYTMNPVYANKAFRWDPNVPYQVAITSISLR